MVTALTGPGWRKGSAWLFSQGSAKYPTAVAHTCRERAATQAWSFSLCCRAPEERWAEPKYNGPLVTARLAPGDVSSNRYSGRYCGEEMDCGVFF